MATIIHRYRKAADFRAALTTYADQFFDTVTKDSVGVIATLIWEGILITTPVLTGRARRNWNVSVGSPDTQTTTEVAGVAMTGSPITSQEKAMIADAIRSYKRAPLGTALIMNNSLHYVPFLEAGSSAKAPSGIREVAIRRALNGAI